MTAKQITDLTSADSFNEGDLLLIRESGKGVDKKINYTDFIQSIGNSAISGYIASLDENNPNRIVLRTVNNAPVYRYLDGMKISFRVPAKTTEIVQVRIGSLDYKNLYQRKADITVTLVQDDYVEAVFIDGNFYRVNDPKEAAEKKITELEIASSFAEKDLLEIRKHGEEENRKINYSDFVQSIGNPAINGYTAKTEEGQENKIILKAVNEAPVYKYCQGMKLSFRAPAKTTGVVCLRIGNLDYKNLYRHKSEITVALEEEDYVEAILIGEHFYHVNDFKAVANIYTNDYNCIFHEMPTSGVLTDLTLITAFGLYKQEYYNGMSINFVCPIDTKGMVRVNIDGLGLKDIIEGDIEDFLYTPLYKGQIVNAIFNGVCFVKNKYRTEENRVSLEPSPVLSANGTPQAIIPPEKQLEFNIGVGLTGCGIIFHFVTLRKALETLLAKYTDNSGYHVTLNILSPLDILDNNIIIEKRDLSWITLKGDSQNKIRFTNDSSYNIEFLHLKSCRNFNFAKNTVIFHSWGKYYDHPSRDGIFTLGDSNPSRGRLFTLEDCNFHLNDVTVEHLGRLGSYFIFGNGNITMNNVTVKNFRYSISIHTDGFMVGSKSIITLTNSKLQAQAQAEFPIRMSTPNSELTLINCDLSLKVKGEIEIGKIFIEENFFSTITQINSRAKAQWGSEECQPNVDNYRYKYHVIGSQDEVGISE